MFWDNLILLNLYSIGGTACSRILGALGIVTLCYSIVKQSLTAQRFKREGISMFICIDPLFIAIKMLNKGIQYQLVKNKV